ncbi:MAG: calcium/sodium antiporter [Planctomycetota bacterium]
MIIVAKLIVGFALLVAGGELVVRGASNIATTMGMSKLLVGLTVVAFGTSAPELAICLDAVWIGKPDIALGNIVGSNISNVLLILGLTATIFPIVIHRQIVQREVPIMIGVSLLFFLLTIDGVLHPAEGIVLVVGMAVFVYWQIRYENRVKLQNDNLDSSQGSADSISPMPDETKTSVHSIWIGLLFVGFGIVCLWFGAGWLVNSASEMATELGVSKLVIGLTIVAIGSSAPEIVTSLLAAKRGHPELAVGSVIGSNIANLLLVGGTTAAFSPVINVPPEAFQFDIPVMLVASIACLPIFATGHTIDRWEGVFFLFCFAAFNAVVFLKPVLNDSLPAWQQLVWPFAIPIVLVTCLAVALHNFKAAQNT